MDKELQKQLLELSRRFEKAQAFDTYEKEAALDKYLGDLKDKASTELKQISTEFKESGKITDITERTQSRISTENKLTEMLSKARQLELENGFDIKSQADKPLAEIKIPGEKYNKYRTESLEVLDYVSDLIRISGKSPQEIGDGMVNSLVEDLGNFIALEDRHLLNSDESKNLTDAEFQRLQLAASRIGLKLDAENVKGEKGDKINILIDNTIKASVNVTFANDDIGKKKLTRTD